MPFLEGKTLTGWGVVSLDPWHFVGMFPTRQEAEREAEARGEKYVVRFGDNKEGTDEFLWSGTGEGPE